MTIYDKGLLRAMKAAYKDSGYIVAVTEDSVIIQTTFWGGGDHESCRAQQRQGTDRGT